ncbi:MAG TPA: outer membrane lipoprotein carrier protein LolA [Dysgonomonas sp.]|uniref:outer membrane lipoprotein carrier protein LolA n=1 Tax=unclassified Dysgonomonas TaxID=2630389 RepID=UPI0025B8B065|nr:MULTISPECIES: outer membrane lipoprotein carrier protein LolA [unclassified Dysgonomonas]HML65266.1 outer membrane lipoprotein carrier protein LolA [Dysgonomonas sp.]
MKKTFILFIVAIILCGSMFAQEIDTWKNVRLYKGANTMTAIVTRIRHSAAVADDVTTKGNFYYKKPDRMCMTFNDGKDMLLMDGAVFTMINNGKKSVAKGSTHKQFESLRAIVHQLTSNESNGIDIGELADVKMTKQTNMCVLTITPVAEDAKAKRKMMFSSFVLTIDTQSTELKSLRMNEKGDNYTLYKFSGYVLNAAVKDDIFNTDE